MSTGQASKTTLHEATPNLRQQILQSTLTLTSTKMTRRTRTGTPTSETGVIWLSNSLLNLWFVGSKDICSGQLLVANFTHIMFLLATSWPQNFTCMASSGHASYKLLTLMPFLAHHSVTTLILTFVLQVNPYSLQKFNVIYIQLFTLLCQCYRTKQMNTTHTHTHTLTSIAISKLSTDNSTV